MDQGKQKSEKKLTLEELKRKLVECQKQRNEYLAGWQRARADYLNYKKEEGERAVEILKYAAESLTLKILPILDNFELAEKNLPTDLKEDDSIKGLLQIKTQLQDFLKNQGVEKIKTIGQKFDPSLHEAVDEIELEDKESGTIIEEVQKGYKLNGRVIRPAKVKTVK